jgi:hypothetical protein
MLAGAVDKIFEFLRKSERVQCVRGEERERDRDRERERETESKCKGRESTVYGRSLILTLGVSVERICSIHNVFSVVPGVQNVFSGV